jgi:NADH-quinone oxidoreductase subunit C
MAETAVQFAERLCARFPDAIVTVAEPRGEVGIEFSDTAWHSGCEILRDEFAFESLVDLCGVDYLGYGSDEWDTEVSSEGFSRGVEGRGPGRFKYGETTTQESDRSMVRLSFRSRSGATQRSCSCCRCSTTAACA